MLDADGYIAIVDGQHRYRAAQNSNRLNSLVFMQCYSNANTPTLLSTMNYQSKVWNGSDYICGAAIMNPEDEDIKFLKELNDKKFPLSTIGLIYYCGDTNKLTKATLANVFTGKDFIKGNLEMAKKFRKIKVFDDKQLKSRYIIQAFIDVKSHSDFNSALDTYQHIPEEIVSQYITTKGEDKKALLVDWMNKYLTKN